MKNIKTGTILISLTVILFFAVTSTSGYCSEVSNSQNDKNGWAVLPFASYSESNEFLLGFDLLHYFSLVNRGDLERRSYILSQLKSSEFDSLDLLLQSELYFNQMHISALFHYEGLDKQLPNHDTATGQENSLMFIPKNYTLELAVEQLITTHIYFGLKYHYLNSENEFDNPDVADSSDYPGIDGGVTSSIGINFKIDSRDNIFSTRTGQLFDFSILFSPEFLGNDNVFTRFNMDYRNYQPITDNVSVSLRFFTDLTSGDIPFYEMSDITGCRGLRMIEPGEFIGDNSAIAQAEIHFPLIWKFDMVTFFETGLVFDEFEDIDFNNLKYSAGCGLRYKLDEENKVNLRLDIGTGSENSFGISFSILELF